MRKLPEDGLEEGAFPRAIFTDDGHQLSAMGVKADIFDQRGVPGSYCDVFNLQAVQSTAADNVPLS